MDASLLLAIDGLREVAHTASEVIVSNAGDDEKKDRSAFAVASDVEVGCLTVLGTKLDVPGDSSAPARRNIFDALSMLPGIMRPKDANGEAGPQPPDAPALAAADAMKRAVTNARLAPVTDVVIVHNGDPVPTGFQRVAWSVTGMYPADLNAVCRRVASVCPTGMCKHLHGARSLAVLWDPTAVDRRRALPYRAAHHRPLRGHAGARGVHSSR